MSFGKGEIPLQIDYPEVSFYTIPKSNVKEKFEKMEKSDNVSESYVITIGSSQVTFPKGNGSGMFREVKNLEQALDLFKEKLTVP